MFLEEAEKDKERYMKELELYQQTESYKKFVAKQKAMKQNGQLGSFTVHKVSTEYNC